MSHTDKCVGLTTQTPGVVQSGLASGGGGGCRATGSEQPSGSLRCTVKPTPYGKETVLLSVDEIR